MFFSRDSLVLIAIFFLAMLTEVLHRRVIGHSGSVGFGLIYGIGSAFVGYLLFRVY